MFCSAATVATTVAFYCCYLLLLSLLLFLATAIARYTVVTRYFAVTTVLVDTNLSGVVEFTTQLLILENILSLPLVSNQQIWVE